MWHLLTKLGTFWIADAKEKGNEKYVLGIDDDTLGIYNRLEDVIVDIKAHNTGDLEWDSQTRLKIPDSLQEWKEGEPKGW